MLVKGIYLKTPLRMTKYTEEDILSELDSLKQEGSEATDCDEFKMAKRTYFSDNLFICVYTFSDKAGIESMWPIFFVLQEAIPNFIKAFKYEENMIITAWQSIDLMSPGILVEELYRVVAFFIKDCLGDIDEAILKTKSFFDFCIYYTEEND